MCAAGLRMGFPAWAKMLCFQRVTKGWLGRLDSNQGMAESKSAALPLGYAPTRWLAPRIAAVSAEFNETVRPAGSRPTAESIARRSDALASPSPGGGGSAKHRT